MPHLCKSKATQVDVGPSSFFPGQDEKEQDKERRSCPKLHSDLIYKVDSHALFLNGFFLNSLYLVQLHMPHLHKANHKSIICPSKNWLCMLWMQKEYKDFFPRDLYSFTAFWTTLKIPDDCLILCCLNFPNPSQFSFKFKCLATCELTGLTGHYWKKNLQSPDLPKKDSWIQFRSNFYARREEPGKMQAHYSLKAKIYCLNYSFFFLA